MIDKDVALAALSALCNANVTSIQKLRAQDGAASAGTVGGPAPQQLSVNNLISSVLNADETCEVSRNNFVRLQRHLEGDALSRGLAAQSGGLAALSRGFAKFLFGPAGPSPVIATPPPVIDTPPPVIDTPPSFHCKYNPILESLPEYIINENEFFDPGFDYDFTNLRDTETYSRGGEVYERPCGWQRFALRVLDKYDGNAWLGTLFRSTQSVPGEWPVSYHGTSNKGAYGIFDKHYKPGPGQRYGWGIYSTPYIEEAIQYSKTFTSEKDNKTYRVILQNRINPQYRQKCNDDKYWLIPIPQGTCDKDEKRMVERAIRPYGLLLQEV